MDVEPYGRMDAENSWFVAFSVEMGALQGMLRASACISGQCGAPTGAIALAIGSRGLSIAAGERLQFPSLPRYHYRRQ